MRGQAVAFLLTCQIWCAFSEPTCCWSEWTVQSECAGYEGTGGGRCNTDWSMTCNNDGECHPPTTTTILPPDVSEWTLSTLTKTAERGQEWQCTAIADYGKAVSEYQQALQSNSDLEVCLFDRRGNVVVPIPASGSYQMSVQCAKRGAAVCGKFDDPPWVDDVNVEKDGPWCVSFEVQSAEGYFADHYKDYKSAVTRYVSASSAKKRCLLASNDDALVLMDKKDGTQDVNSEDCTEQRTKCGMTRKTTSGDNGIAEADASRLPLLAISAAVFGGFVSAMLLLAMSKRREVSQNILLG